MPHFDVVIIGGGPAGERAAIQAARHRRRSAIVERAHVIGGTRINWGTIPSKTLRESAMYVHGLKKSSLYGIRIEFPDEITIADFMTRERAVVQQELELATRALDRYQVQVFRGAGRFVDAHTVAVHGADGRTRAQLTGDVVVIATGTRPARPADVPFDGRTVVDSDTILAVPRMPRSMIVLGAGVIGVEYASIFAALGIDVTLVDTRDQLLPYLDREIAQILETELRRLGVVRIPDDHYRTIEQVEGDPPSVRVTTRKGSQLEADLLLYSVGRQGNTDDLALETVGLAANDRGLLEVNEFYQTAVPHLYAVGDVIGYPALASTSMEQGRQAIRHAFGIPGLKSRTETLPFAIYAIPEVGYVGETEEQLRDAGVPYVAGRGRYDLNARGQITGLTGGLLKLLFEKPSMRLRGAHIVGHTASELVHIGQAFLSKQAAAQDIAETLFNYPTFSDMYRHAALEALAKAGTRA
ncbi:MAG: Si-specific NAD(P)(+) transhydrogenase [Acidobacteria bacterium]|jgi:NAD(P) transhydrogenase|nr:Si-specific NAD(P)(+) transhydrogenase [Acidobacteriota bacterium]